MDRIKFLFNLDYFLFNVSLLLLIVALLSHIISMEIILGIMLGNFIISAYLLRGKDKLQKNEKDIIGLIYSILGFGGVILCNRGHVPAPPDPIFYILLGIAITGLVGVNLLKCRVVINSRFLFNLDYFLFNVSLFLLIVALLFHSISYVIVILIMGGNFILNVSLFSKRELQKNEENIITLIYFTLGFGGFTFYSYRYMPSNPIFYILLGTAIIGLVEVNLLKVYKRGMGWFLRRMI